MRCRREGHRVRTVWTERTVGSCSGGGGAQCCHTVLRRIIFKHSSFATDGRGHGEKYREKNRSLEFDSISAQHHKIVVPVVESPPVENARSDPFSLVATLLHFSHPFTECNLYNTGGRHGSAPRFNVYTADAAFCTRRRRRLRRSIHPVNSFHGL